MDNRTIKLNEIETFVFIHDQDILLRLINSQKYKNFDKLTWVFLGNKNTNKLNNVSNIIIAKDLNENIEQYPKLTSFTGWYALCKNNLIKSDYINLFEYDIMFNENFYSVKIDKNKNDFVGYFPMSITDPVFIDMDIYIKPLLDSLFSKTNVDIKSIINLLPKNNLWASSSNSTWNTDTLNNYVNWFEQFLNDIIDNKYCGHMFERSISFYHIIKQIKVLLTNGLMLHLQINSHGTSPLSNLRSERMLKMLIS